jgi:uncharacterized protein
LYKITTDVFYLPYKENESILYAPLLGFASIVNQSFVNLLADLSTLDTEKISEHEKKALDYLIQKGVINGTEIFAPVSNRKGIFAPSKLTLFPTNQCNLQCKYCYASSGQIFPRVMDWEIATSAVDYFVKLLETQERELFLLELHGGGEPLYAWQLVQKIIYYAEEQCKKKNIKLEVIAGTNGVLTEKQLKWIIDHFASLNVSFDGLPHVQDYHRPMAKGTSSFVYVDKAFKFFDEHNFPYGIRCSVSAYNEILLEETIDFITNNYKTKLIYLEPVNSCGRTSNAAELKSPNLYKFIEIFTKIDSLCRERGVYLRYSGANLERLSNTFCYVGTDDFAVTPDGYLTNCWEVSSQDHPLAKTFIFGRILPAGEVEIDQEKLAFLKNLTLDKFQYCQDCFAKWHCAGDCVTRLGHENYFGDRGGERCETTRLLLKNRIMDLFDQKGFYQQINN